MINWADRYWLGLGHGLQIGGAILLLAAIMEKFL